MKLFLITCFLLSPIVSFAINLGNMGKTYKIAEENLLEVIEDRASKVDWGALVENSKKDLKDNLGKVDKMLPKASDNATRYIDMTRVLDHDIKIRDKAGNPKILYPKGYKFNVLDYTTLNTTFIIFDATRPEEVEWYKSKYSETLNAMPIITRGSAYNFSQELGREVFILDDTVASTFQLSTTPTVVYQEKNRLRADEFYLPVKEQK